jgi:hypothetical protein
MTPRQAKLVAASEAVDSCKRQIETDWPRSKMDNPMLTPMQREIYLARQLDVAALDLASKTVMAVAEDPDAYGLLMKLRAEKPADFRAIMVLVQIELERKPAEQAVAA